MNIKNKIISDRTKGYTLLYAILLAGVVMIVGVSILMIGKKELMLSEGLTESQKAIYAADAGLECFKAWDNTGKFATSSRANDSGIKYQDITCNNSASRDISNIYEENGGNMPITFDEGSGRWELKMSDDVPSNEIVYVLGIDIAKDPNYSNNDDVIKKFPCFAIRVYKTWDDASVWPNTTITSKGYSTCDPTDARRVERTLELNY